ncbi:sestrin-1 isoform X5 [Hemicordylus capensis]|uniref:sestrin-1 isoform X5 n=1 Tax=Hemicordylus capensis TaxID=884348 RepID=UPI0023021E13|nr:sestrin-1 isoform X5 [Hemicordylus capensis]
MADRDGEVRWDGLCSRDAGSRDSALENIRQAVLKKSEAIALIKENISPPPAAAEGLLLPSANKARGVLNEMLARLLMLSKRCPFRDVREKSGAILVNVQVQELGIRIPRPLGQGPSRFIPEMEILQVGTEDTQMHTLFAEAFTTLGRLDNITLVMVFHPQYLESFLKTQHYLLQMDGPLPLHYRHYIGIMAAARHQCSYLVNLHVSDFLHVGGEVKWLNGLENAPQKLQNLGELNKILAHRPWLITKEHIEQLLKTEEHSWSLAELIHAVVLLTHYHSLASFTFGCGINPEIHCEGGHTFKPPSVSDYCICDITNGNHGVHDMQGPTGSVTTTEPSCEVEALMEKMKQLQECRDEVKASKEEKATRFEKEKRESMLVCCSGQNILGQHTLKTIPICDREDEELPPTRDVSRHFEDTSYGYKDFSRHGMHVPTFHVQDYSWEDHGYSLVNRLYPDVGQLIDEKFQIAYNLTYNTMAMHKDVDTSMLRRAIWNYIHCMFGIREKDSIEKATAWMLLASLCNYMIPQILVLGGI